MTIKPIRIVERSNGMYVNLQDVIQVVLYFHNMYPCMTSQHIFDELRLARGEYYDSKSRPNPNGIDNDTGGE